MILRAYSRIRMLVKFDLRDCLIHLFEVLSPYSEQIQLSNSFKIRKLS